MPTGRWMNVQKQVLQKTKPAPSRRVEPRSSASFSTQNLPANRERKGKKKRKGNKTTGFSKLLTEVKRWQEKKKINTTVKRISTKRKAHMPLFFPFSFLQPSHNALICRSSRFLFRFS